MHKRLTVYISIGELLGTQYSISEFDSVIRVPVQGIKVVGESLPSPSYPEIERILISKKCIKSRVDAIAKQIAKDYSRKGEIYCLVMLKGALIFFADLMRALHKYPKIKQIKFDAIKAKNYIDAESKDVADLCQQIIDINGKDILIVEDIIDTGITMDRLKRILLEKGAKKVKICTLLNKAEKRKVDLEVDYICFEIPDLFIVGYGIDYEEKYRALPHIAYIKK